MLYIDKYRPSDFNEFIVHKDRADQLTQLLQTGDFPHTLVYGPQGSGKKTIIKSMLKQVYGEGASKVKVEATPWKVQTPSRSLELEITMVSSTFHVELNPSDVGNNDRYIIQEVIKDMAANRPVGQDGSKGFKVLVLYEVDRLSKQAQHALRRTMEKYSSAARLVMCCTNVSMVIGPIRSRCLGVRVPGSQPEQIQELLAHVCQKENINLPLNLSYNIAEYSEGNLRRALLSLQACCSQQMPLQDNQAVVKLDWEVYISEIANDICQEQSPQRLFQVRGKIYELIINCIPPDVIIEQLTMELLKKVDDDLKVTVVCSAAEFEARMRQGSKPIYHIEAFIAKFMSDYNQWVVSALDF